MAIYLVNHKHGCGCEEIEAESPEQAIAIRRSQLTDREASYPMFATVAAADEKPHTPGPWEASVYSGQFDQPLVTSATGSICRVTSQDDRVHEANARLIAAAPELLAALENLSDWGRTYTSPLDADSPHELLIAAINAIAKATGEN